MPQAPPDVDVALLRSFAAAARLGSLSNAARTLGFTQPAVSQQLRRLERGVGAALLHRGTRGVALTPIGATVLRYAERVLALVDELARVASPATPGVYRIGLLEDVAAGPLAAVLADFAAVDPAATLDVRVADGPALGRVLTAGTLDLVVGDPRSVGAVAGGPRRRAPFRLAWAAHPRLDLAADPLPVVLCHAPCAWRAGVVDALDAAGRRWRPVLETPSLTAVQAAVAAGLGVSALLPYTVPDGTAIVDAALLPEAPHVDLALYARSGAERFTGLARLEALLWRALG